MVAFASQSSARPKPKGGKQAPPAQPAPAPAEQVGSGRSVERIITPKPATLERRLRFQQIGRDSGLPSSQVSSIVQDRAGFVWLATSDGLARYDGQRFLVFRFDPRDKTSLSTSYVTRLLVAKDGALWVGTEGGGVNRYHPGDSTFERFLPSDAPDTLKSGSILALAEGSDGKIWIGTGGGGLSVLDPRTRKAQTFGPEDGLSVYVSAIVPEPDGGAWLGTDSGVFRQRPGKGFEPVNNELLTGSTITKLGRAREGGDLWIGTDAAGLVRYSPGTGKIKSYRAAPDDPHRLIHDSITAIYADRAGRIWVGTPKGLHTLDPKTDRIDRHLAESSDPMGLWTTANDLFEDAAGALWIGTIGQGAVLLDPLSQHFSYYHAPGVPSMALGSEELWVGTGEGLCRWRGEGRLVGLCYSLEFPTAVFVNRSGTAWIGTFPEGLARLDPATTDRWREYKNDQRDPKSLGPGAVMRMYEDEAGDIWVGLLGGGLQRYDRDRDEFVGYDIGSDQVYAIAPDPANKQVLWIGTADRGVVKLNVPAVQMDSYIPNPNDIDSKTDNAVVNIVFQGNFVWLPTFGGGLKRLDLNTGRFKSYRRSDGMPSDTIYGALLDKGGKLWLSTPAGLVRFDPRTERMQVFSQVDGLQGDEFTLGTRAATKDGRFIFAGMGGFNIFRPEQIQVDRYAAPLVLTSITVLGQQLRTGEPLQLLRTFSLDFDETIASLEFAGLSFSGSKRMQFEYKLEGLNDQWFPAASATVNLNGLKDGDYTLQVRARNRHGVESKPVQLGIVVAPPPWRSWWAYSAYALVLIGIGLAVYRYQRGRIRRLQMVARLATVEREFEVTATVQSWFLPEPGVHRAGICDLVGFYRAADTCSGDWWWYEDIGGGKLWIIVADVTGHGAAPAMLTAAVAMGIGVQSEEQSVSDVSERLSRVNKEVLSRCRGKATMTMTAVVLDTNTGDIVVYCLGGLPAVLVNQEGRHVISTSGTPLGSVETLDMGQRSARMRPGDRLIITTDGIVETTMNAGRPLGFRRFVNVIQQTRTVPLDQAVDAIVQEVDRARSTRPQEDDFTFCLIEHR